MMETQRRNQQESWNNCVKNAAIKYKQAENKYRTQRLKTELIHDGIIPNASRKKATKDYIQAKNQLELAINHKNWAQDGLNDFMDQCPSY